MCCDEVKVSEDIRVIHNELEKAYTWIFAAQEILENEEFEPYLKDIGHIETVLSFAIQNLKAAISYCEIYRGGHEVITKLEKQAPFPSKATTPTAEVKKGVTVDKTTSDFLQNHLSQVKLKEAQEALGDLEKKLSILKSTMNTDRIKLTPEELKLYKDR